MNEPDTETTLVYEEVIEYLSDRKGDPAQISAYPTFDSERDYPELAARGEPERHPEHPAGGPTLLGLTVHAVVGKIEPVSLLFSEKWLRGQAGVEIPLEDGESGERFGQLVLTREWFADAVLENGAGALRIVVRADTGSAPLFPPVGQKDDPEHEFFTHELVGWGFGFDFSGEPPWTGRWSERVEANG